MAESSVPDLLEQVAEAFDRKDYRSATQVLKELWKQQPGNPQVQLYRGRLYEVAGKLDQARDTYKHLLKAVPTPKLMAQARQGIERVDQLDREQRQREIARSIAAPNQDQQGLLILEAIAQTDRPAAAQALSKIMAIDGYSARLQLPNRGWRIYRMGPIGEMALYGQQLRSSKIPAFWVTEESLHQPKLVQVNHVIQTGNHPKVSGTCAGDAIEIDWNGSDVTSSAQGSSPIFDRALEFDPLRREYSSRARKETVKDYAVFFDLHLKSRNLILRFCDRTYDFQSGVRWESGDRLERTGLRSQWNHILQWFKPVMDSKPFWNDFAPFSDTATDFVHLLKAIDPGFYLYGQEESRINAAFHLYSLLAFHRAT